MLCLLAACGRIGFDDLQRGTGDAAGGDGASDSAADGTMLTTSITHVGTFAAHSAPVGPSDAFTVQGNAVGDVVALQVACASAVPPTSVMVMVNGWNFDALDSVQGNGMQFSEQLVAIVPDTLSHSISVKWTGSSCDMGMAELGDEFAGVNTSGGITSTFAGGAQQSGTGNCKMSFATLTPAETIWVACVTYGTVTGVNAGFVQGATNSTGDEAAYRISTDPAGFIETPTLLNTNTWLMDAIELRPQ